jgi:hypothetical protein
MPKQNNIPIVPLKAFIKHSLEILQNPLPFHLQNFEKLGDIFRLKIGLTNSVFFSRNAALAEYVLQKNQKNYKKSKIQTQDLAKYVGTGLLTAEGEHWRTQRRLIQPAFHKKQLNKLTESINNAISEEYSKITPYTVVNVFPVFNDLAFQTVVKSLFSSAVDQNSINRLQYITEAAQRMMVKELRQPYLGWWFTASGKIKKHIDLTIEARQILKTIVNERKSSGKRADDLLDMLLDAKYDDGSAMQEAQLLDEILILFTAGHETTANALTFTCQLLAQHPEWQDKIFDEVTSNKNQADDLMTTLSASKLCKAVIEESMRLYPPAYFIDRVNIEADTFDGMHFEPDSNLLFSVYEIHRHPELWEQPNAFLPQRFLDGSQKFSSQYFPFGAGPRKCIGNNFAMFEMIVAINQLVSKFKIYPHFKTIGITPLITLKPKNANLRFEER